MFSINRYSTRDNIDRLLEQNEDKENNCISLILLCKDKEGIEFKKEYGVFRTEKDLNKHMPSIRELISKNTKFEINTDEEPDHFLYYLRDLFDRENMVIGYETKIQRFYE